MVLISNSDYGDTLAAVQSLLKKDQAFQTDFKVHKQRLQEIIEQGNELIEQVGFIME